MGRGLSALQKTMLKMSMDKLERYQKTIHSPAYLAASYVDQTDILCTADVNHWGGVRAIDVLVKVYGWSATTTYSGWRCLPKSEIGQKPYMAAYIAVRKSVQRLAKRGLIATHPNNYSQYWITEEGKKYLLAKLTPNPEI